MFIEKDKPMEKILYLIPEISLLLGVIFLLFQKYFTDVSIKGYFKTAKIIVLISAIFAVLFYNKSVFPMYLEVSSFTSLFYVLSCFVVFFWLLLSVKWFVSEDLEPFSFCILSLFAMLCFSIIIKAVDLKILFAGFSMLSLINYKMLKFSQQNEEFHNSSKRYAIISLLFIMLMFISIWIIGKDNTYYIKAAEIIGMADTKVSIFIFISIIFFLLFLFNIAPLHFCFADMVAPAVLPIALYLSLVPLLALFACFIKLNTSVFMPVKLELNTIYICFGLLSLIFGAIGANSSRNLRKIFAYSGIYNLGMLLLLLSSFTSSSLYEGFIYLQIYILALFGVYTCFYSFKSNGVYLANLNMINGIAKVRPFVSASMLFFMISLMGIAPFPGFIGQLFALESFIEYGNYFIVFVALVTLIILMSAYLQIIRSVYFNKKDVDFNRPDYGIYIYLVINIIVIMLLVFNPNILLYDMITVFNLVLV